MSRLTNNFSNVKSYYNVQRIDGWRCHRIRILGVRLKPLCTLQGLIITLQKGAQSNMITTRCQISLMCLMWRPCKHDMNTWWILLRRKNRRSLELRIHWLNLRVTKRWRRVPNTQRRWSGRREKNISLINQMNTTQRWNRSMNTSRDLWEYRNRHILQTKSQT